MKTSPLELAKAAVDESTNVSIASTPRHLSTLITKLEENEVFFNLYVPYSLFLNNLLKPTLKQLQGI